MAFSEKDLNSLIEKDPLTRAMFERYASNKRIEFNNKRVIDKKHIEFLLMMPEDLLEADFPSGIFYKNIRRLAAVELFLKGKEPGEEALNAEVAKTIKRGVIGKIKSNELLAKGEINLLRKAIKNKIKKIRGMLAWEKKTE